MKNANLFVVGAALMALCGTMYGQTGQSAGIVYQQAGAIGAIGGGPGGISSFFHIETAGAGVMGGELVRSDTVAGSPFSATRMSHSLQVLGDGTRIERSDSEQIFRDSLGRIRTEESRDARTVTIQDPVAGTTIVLDTANKTAQEIPVPRVLRSKAVSGNTIRTGQIQAAIGPSTTVSIAGNKGMLIAQAGVTGGVASTMPVIEDLPAQNVNGVLAVGRRTTLTIPAGEIGNDRAIQVVGETWYSADLQMVVKSSNSDPRFGDTSYELTNIVRNEPDPTLFKAPADYPLTEGQMILPPPAPAAPGHN